MFSDLLVSEGRSQTQATLTLKSELRNSWQIVGLLLMLMGTQRGA